MIDCSSPATSELCVRRLISEAEIARSQELRFRVWSEQEGVILPISSRGRLKDPLDSRAVHWGAFVEDQMVGSARLTLHDSVLDAPDAHLFGAVQLPVPVGSMNRLVIDAAYRGKRIAEKLDDTRISFSRQQGAKALLITPVIRGSGRRIEALSTLGFSNANVTGRASWSDQVPVGAMYLIL